MVPLSHFRPTSSADQSVWHSRIRSVTHFIGALHRQGSIWDDRRTVFSTSNPVGCHSRFNEIHSSNKIPQWIENLERQNVIPAKPSMTDTIVRMEQIDSLMKEDEFRSFKLWSLRDIHPEGIRVDEFDQERVYVSSSPIQCPGRH